jgi:hypothetical protein
MQSPLLQAGCPKSWGTSCRPGAMSHGKCYLRIHPGKSWKFELVHPALHPRMLPRDRRHKQPPRSHLAWKWTHGHPQKS